MKANDEISCPLGRGGLLKYYQELLNDYRKKDQRVYGAIFVDQEDV